MIGVSRRSDYALVALAEIATGGGVRQSASSLAVSTGVPDALLRNLLKSLARSGVLHSERGPFGGYTLARPSTSITVLEIVEAIDGPVEFVRCCGHAQAEEGAGCLHTARCRIRMGMQHIHAEVRELLGRVTVSDLIDWGEAGHARAVPVRVGGVASPAGAGDSVDLAAGVAAGVADGQAGRTAHAEIECNGAQDLAPRDGKDAP